RPDGAPRGCTTLLRDRAQDRTGRAFGAVQSGPVLCAVKGSGASRNDVAARRLPRQRRPAGAAESRAGGRAPGPLGGGRDDRAHRTAARTRGRERRLLAADAGAAEPASDSDFAAGHGQREPKLASGRRLSSRHLGGPRPESKSRQPADAQSDRNIAIKRLSTLQRIMKRSENSFPVSMIS